MGCGRVRASRFDTPLKDRHQVIRVRVRNIPVATRRDIRMVIVRGIVMVITMGRREYRSRRGIIRQSGLVPGHMRMAGSMGIMPDTRRVFVTESQVSLHKEFIAPFDPAGVHERRRSK